MIATIYKHWVKKMYGWLLRLNNYRINWEERLRNWMTRRKEMGDDI